jgi:TIR domain
MAHDVFISYSSVDKTIADAVCAKLEEKKIRCWIAPRDVIPGAAYAGEIVEAINQSDLLVLILSSHSNTSGQVLREVERAVSKSLPILPFRIEQVELSQSLEYFLSTPHWLDAITPPVEKHLNHLVGTVEVLLARSAKNLAPQLPDSDDEQVSWPESTGRAANKVTKLAIWKMVAGAAAVLATVICVYLLVAMYFPEGHDTPAGVAKLTPIVEPEADSESTDKKAPADDSLPPKNQPAAPAAEPAQKITGDVLRDNDYAFEITRPSAEWRFFSLDETAELNPDACAGLYNVKKQSFYVVTAEQLPEVALFDYINGKLQTLALTNRTEFGPKSIELAGQPAAQAIVSGKLQGTVEVTYMVNVVKKGSWFFQLTGWAPGPELGAAEEEMKALANSLVFLADRDPKFRPQIVKPVEQYGVDWRITDGEYENVSFDYRLTAGPGWRYAPTIERMQIAPQSDVSILFQQPWVSQSIFAETVGPVSAESLWELFRRQFEDLIGLGQPNETSSIDSGDLNGRQAIYFDADSSGVKFDYAYALLNSSDGKTLFHVHTRWQSADRAAALEKLTDSQKFLSRLSRHESAVLKQELLKGDADNAVGLSYSLRGGVFQDFEHGVVFRRPGDGLWKMLVGPEAKASFPAAVLYAQCPQLGIGVVVIPENIPGISHEEYHQILNRNLTNPSETRTETIGDLEFMISQADQQLGSLAFTTCLVTTVKDERHVQLLIHGPQDNMRDIQVRLPSIVKCLSLPDVRPVATVVEKTHVRDYRLGFEFSTELPGYELEVLALPFGIETYGSGAALSDESGACAVMAMCIPDMDEKFIREALVEHSGISEFNLQDQMVKPDSLAGLPAQRLDCVGRIKQRDVAFTVCTLRRGQTMYALIAIRERGKSDAEDEEVLLSKYFNFFSLLPEDAVAN